MRLWHYKLIPYLPKSQLLAQWRELNSIFKKQDKHILINYVYEYPKVDLLEYTLLVIYEMNKRNYKIKSFENAYMYFQELLCAIIFKENYIPNEFIDGFKSGRRLFVYHHTDRYLLQNFYNLQEKYERGQNDFTEDLYFKLVDFVKNEIPSNLIWSGLETILETMWFGPSKPPHITEKDTGIWRRLITNEKCWKTGNYTDSCNCESCMHKHECSGYEGGKDDE